MLVAALVVLATGWSTPAWADAKSELEAAQAHWAELDYELVVAAADRVLAASPSKTQRLEALRLKGSALVILKDSDGASTVTTAALAAASAATTDLASTSVLPSPPPSSLPPLFCLDHERPALQSLSASALRGFGSEHDAV